MTRFNDLMAIIDVRSRNTFDVIMHIGSEYYLYVGDTFDYLKVNNPIIEWFDITRCEILVESEEITKDNYKLWEVC